MNQMQYRSFMPDLQVRSGGDGRTIYGIAVPFNAPVRIDGNLIEQFARGSFNHQLDRPQRVRFARDHLQLGGTLIGAATTLRDDAAGLYVELRASRTPVGDETLELVRDGALNELSIAFREGKNRKLPGGITERVQADLREVAVVMQGAYGELATAVGLRSSIERQEQVDADLRAVAAPYVTRGLPDLDDLDTELQMIRMGLRT